MSSEGSSIVITDYFINKPVLTTAISLLIVCAGYYSLLELPIRLFPRIEIPVLTITTTLSGTDAATMQSYVTSILSKAISGIEGLDYITSSSSIGQSEIVVHMQVGQNTDIALNNIKAKISAVRDTLPAGVTEPVINKSSVDDDPAMIIAFTSKSLSREDMAEILRQNIAPKLETIDGVESAQVMGRKPAINIWLDPIKMATYHLTTQDVTNCILQQNLASQSGSLLNTDSLLNLNLVSGLSNIDQFNQIIVNRTATSLVRLKDIGEAKIGAESDKINAFYNGKPAAMLFIKLFTNANPIKTLDKVHDLMSEISTHLPADLHGKIVIDSGSYLRSSIREVILTIIQASIIVILVLLVFTGSFSAVVIPLTTIPLSLIGVCFIIYLLNYSINTLTLLAMVLAIGLVVDDAIVVVENILRRMESGENCFQAAILATREIMNPVVAMTISLAVIFVPLCFSRGLSGQLFSEFAATLAGAVIISGIIALTLSPLMAVKFLQIKSTGLQQFTNQWFTLLQTYYLKSLVFILNKRSWVSCLWMVSVLGSVYLYHSCPKELAPSEDQGFLQILSRAADTTNSNYIANYSQSLNTIYHANRNSDSNIIVSGIPQDHNTMSFVSLKSWDDRDEGLSSTVSSIQHQLNNIPELQSVVLLPPSVPGSAELPIQFEITSREGNLLGLFHAADQISNAARKSGLFLFLKSDLNYATPQLKIDIKRDLAGILAIPVTDISNTLAVFLSGQKIQQANINSHSYPVITHVLPFYRTSPAMFGLFYLRTASGAFIPLTNLINSQITVVPEHINQFQKYTSVQLSGVMANGHTIEEGLNFFKDQVNKMPAFDYDYAGELREFVNEDNRLFSLFCLALLIIFMVLAIQFNSYQAAGIIVAGCIPMSICAGLLFLKLGFASLNIYTQIGLLILIGLITKHGILMTNFAIKFQNQGLSSKEAIIKSATYRLRPIAMTTAAIVLGSLPLVLAKGAGAAGRYNMGLVITTGMSFGTIFTLFFVPVIYTLFMRNK